eukprot:1124446-Pleurochrysis_carterae.AAC.2
MTVVELGLLFDHCAPCSGERARGRATIRQLYAYKSGIVRTNRSTNRERRSSSDNWISKPFKGACNRQAAREPARRHRRFYSAVRVASRLATSRLTTARRSSADRHFG